MGQTRSAARRSHRCWVRSVASCRPQVGRRRLDAAQQLQGRARVRGRGLGAPARRKARSRDWRPGMSRLGRSRSARVPGRPGTKKVPATRPITMSIPRVGVPDPPWSPHHRPHGEQGPVDCGRVRSRPRPAVPDRRGTDRGHSGALPGRQRGGSDSGRVLGDLGWHGGWEAEAAGDRDLGRWLMQRVRDNHRAGPAALTRDGIYI